MLKKEVVKGSDKAKICTLANSFVLHPRLRFWIIGIAILCVYGKTLRFDFIGFDDRELILDNYEYISDFSNISKVFTTHAFYNPAGTEGSHVYYRPMLTLSFMLDAQLSGKSPKFYHVSNILLHIISCLLLLKLLVKFKLTPDLAFVTTLLFAVHPVLTQAVAWIPGRNDSLLAVFVFASFIFLLQYLEKQKTAHLLLHFIFFGLSIFTKETAISAPVLAVLFVFPFYGQQSGAEKKSSWRTISFLFFGYLLVLTPWFFLRQGVMANTTADLSFSALTNSIIGNLPLYLQSIQKSMLPFYLSILSVPKDTNYILSIALVLLVIILLIRSKKRNLKNIFFGLAWFSAFLIPAFVVNILPGFEHRVYLPLIGIILIVSEIDGIKNFSLTKTKHVLMATALFVIFLVVTINHADAFSTKYEFWKIAALNSENSALARMNYGFALSQNGETDKAMAFYKEGLFLNPKEPRIHNNLGIIYARKKMYKVAEEEFKKELQIDDEFSDAYFNLGILYQQTGRDSLMVKSWENAIRVNPKDTGAKNALDRYKQHK